MTFQPLTHCFPWSLVNDRLRPSLMCEIAECGLKNIDLTSNLISGILANTQNIRQWKREAAAAGLSFVDAHVPFGEIECPNITDAEARPLMLERLAVVLRIVSEFGVETCTFHTGNNLDRDIPVEVYHEKLIESLEILVPQAERLGVTIALENIWTAPNTPELLVDAVRRFNSPALGLCYDSGHANLMDKGRSAPDTPPRTWWKTPEEIPWDGRILEKMLPYIVTCHLHDNNGLRDQHLLPGRGNIDWPRTIALLRTAPRLKCIQNEASFTAEQMSPRKVHEIFEELCKA